MPKINIFVFIDTDRAVNGADSPESLPLALQHLDHTPSPVRVRVASFTGDRPQSKKLEGNMTNACHLMRCSLSIQKTLQGIKEKVTG